MPNPAEEAGVGVVPSRRDLLPPVVAAAGGVVGDPAAQAAALAGEDAGPPRAVGVADPGWRGRAAAEELPSGLVEDPGLWHPHQDEAVRGHVGAGVVVGDDVGVVARAGERLAVLHEHGIAELGEGPPGPLPG